MCQIWGNKKQNCLIKKDNIASNSVSCNETDATKLELYWYEDNIASNSVSCNETDAT